MNNVERELDDLKSGKGIRIAKRAGLALMVFYLSLIPVMIFMILNLINGFDGLRMYILILFFIIAIVSKIIHKKLVTYLSYGSNYAKQNHTKQFEKRKISIIGIGTRGTLLLGPLKYKKSPFQKYLNLIAANENILTQYAFNGYIRLPKIETGRFDLAASDIEKTLTNSDLVIIIADYEELISHFATPIITEVVKKAGYRIERYICLPFTYVGEQAMNEAIERVNKLSENDASTLKVYFKAFMMIELKEDDPFKAQEKIEGIILDDISKRISIVINTATTAKQDKDIGKLNDALDN